ncbi:MAG: hypothetical protein ACREHD_04975 [Pirellulales bacterium]
MTTQRATLATLNEQASSGVRNARDPTGFAAGDANTGRYGDNSPTNTVDPTGLAAVQQFPVALKST